MVPFFVGADAHIGPFTWRSPHMRTVREAGPYDCISQKQQNPPQPFGCGDRFVYLPRRKIMNRSSCILRWRASIRSAT